MRARLPLIDSLRGFALLIMFAYHFAFDLDLFGAARIDFHSLPWVAYRSLILTLFLGLVGVSVALAGRTFPDTLRLLRIAAGAGLISAVTWWMFPDAWVYFGILQFVLVASVAATLLVRWPRICALLGSAMLALPWLYRSPAFDGRIAHLMGLGTQLPRTIDFVPLCPWLGVVLLGVFAGSLLPREPRSWLVSGNPILALMGRHSLLLYLTHQGLLLPVAWLVARFGK